MKMASVLIVATATTLGCTSAVQHRADVQDSAADRFTVGTVQKEIHLGMSGAQVATVLGSPNIVSTDADRDEVWIYDKIATDVAYSNSRSGSLGLIFGPVGSGGAGGVGAASQSAGARSTSQRTLTVVINFDSDKRVKDFAYHTSRF